MRYLLLCALFVVGCSQPAPGPQVAPTATSVPATATPAPPNYRAMANALALSLGGVIVAVRDKDARATRDLLARFNAEAEKVEPQIKTDMSVQANILSSAIKNVRTHALDGNLQALESERLRLIDLR